MQGRVLDVSIQTNSGVISGDDGNRYSFTGAGWQIPNTPRPNMRVDFDPDGNTATGIYAEAGIRAATPSIPAPAINRPTPAAAAPAVNRPAPAATPAINRPAPAAATGASRPISVMGIVGLIIGIPTLILFWIPVLGWVLMMAGMGLSISGLVTGKQRGEQTAFAIAGIVLNAIPLTIHIITAVVVSLFVQIVKQAIGDLVPFLKWLPFF